MQKIDASNRIESHLESLNKSTVTVGQGVSTCACNQLPSLQLKPHHAELFAGPAPDQQV